MPYFALSHLWYLWLVVSIKEGVDEIAVDDASLAVQHGFNPFLSFIPGSGLPSVRVNGKHITPAEAGFQESAFYNM